jgi:SpoVK/Ycf46/Vps4 family AAA+-type ATPase
MGATNRPDIIDLVVIRLGRFDPLLPLSIQDPA